MAIGPHERALRKDLRRITPADRAGGLARLGLTLAQVLDDATGDSPAIAMTPKEFTAVCAQFHAVLGTLAKMQEPAAVADPVDEVAAARARRRGAAG